MSKIITPQGFAEDIWAGTPLPPLQAYQGGPALILAPEDDVSAVAAHFDQLDLIVISFETSADGRGFSQAAQLRALGFTGHIRARGHVLVDQFRAALRAGFSDIEISASQAKRNPEHQWLAVPLHSGYQSRLLGVEPQAFVNS